MERYPMLSLVVRYGAIGSYVLAVVAALATLLGTSSSALWVTAVATALVALVTFVIVRSCVELVMLVTDMLVPK